MYIKGFYNISSPTRGSAQNNYVIVNLTLQKIETNNKNQLQGDSLCPFWDG